MQPTEISGLFPAYNITASQQVEYVYPKITLTLSLISSTLSVLGGAAIFISYKFLPEIQNYFSRKLVVSLTVADVLTAFGIWVSVIRYFNLNEDYVMDRSMEDVLCKIQSFVTTLTSLVSFFLTSIIAIYIYDTVTRQSDRLNSRRCLAFFNVISWAIPVCIVTVAISMGVLGGDPTPTGVTGPWCWVSETADNEILWRFVSGKGWEITCYLITTYLYIFLKYHLYKVYRKQSLHNIQAGLRDEDKNFIYVPLVLYLLRLWGTLRFFIRLGCHPTGEEDYMYALLYMQALGDPAQAFCNFVLFCVFDKTVRTKMMKKIFCCFSETETVNEDENLALCNSSSHETNVEYGGTNYIDKQSSDIV